jgi:hypothetical protein
MSLSQIESLSVFGLKEDPIASINKDQQVATDQEGKCKGVLHRLCFIPQRRCIYCTLRWRCRAIGVSRENKLPAAAASTPDVM